jgi:uncharacterized protein YqiB (DUF1249 family)
MAQYELEYSRVQRLLTFMNLQRRSRSEVLTDHSCTHIIYKFSSFYNN